MNWNAVIDSLLASANRCRNMADAIGREHWATQHELRTRACFYEDMAAAFKSGMERQPIPGVPHDVTFGERWA